MSVSLVPDILFVSFMLMHAGDTVLPSPQLCRWTRVTDLVLSLTGVVLQLYQAYLHHGQSSGQTPDAINTENTARKQTVNVVLAC
jgi:hypothetical protein